jgi:hypothetical protein
MNRSLAWLAGLITVLAFLFMLLPALAHESWISDRGLKNGAGEWCCGDYDCKGYNEAISTPKGWVVDGELVPYDEAIPIAPPDGRVTVCRRPDGTRRCVFGIKPGL